MLPRDAPCPLATTHGRTVQRVRLKRAPTKISIPIYRLHWIVSGSWPISFGIQTGLPSFISCPQSLSVPRLTSYTWGRPIPLYVDDDYETRKEKESYTTERNHYVVISGEKLAITQSLLDFLEFHVESHMGDDQSPPLWINAVCIN